jgi:cytoplasmic iron level regulating protein YaaA (DUF328/UPF0246 family)
MIVLLNSSKTMTTEDAGRTESVTLPAFLEDARRLVECLRALSTDELARLLGTSGTLTRLNAERYHRWCASADRSNSCPALLAFKGDVYAGMDAAAYPDDTLAYAQQRVRILSGLYGALRPLDLIEPYRLEMAAKLGTDRGPNLYRFWGERIGMALEALCTREGSGLLVNLASAEYFRSVKKGLRRTRVITPVFKEAGPGGLRSVTLYTKRARGLLCDFILRRRAETLDDLKTFDAEGYRFRADQSSESDLCYVRGD